MSTTQTNRGVPGIPLGAMDAVQDENARIVLQAIVDGLNVRNGATGAGDMAFVTRGELAGSQSALSMGLSRQIDDYTTQVRKITPGMISQVINDLQAQIMESKLFKDLGERVNLIDKPGGIFDRLEAAELVLVQETNQRIEGDTALSARLDVMGTRVGTAEAAISTETTQRVNADNAIQQTISTQYAAVNNNLSLLQSSQTTTANNVAALTTTMQQVQAQVGANAVAIQQETQARAAADGALYAQWTLRVDVAGRVSGFGLASNSTVSDFIVRADRFSIASPSTQDGIAPQMPFIVTTTSQVVNGRSVPPGVYLKNAFIENGAITNANIGIAEIDTLTIRGNAIFVQKNVSFSDATVTRTNNYARPLYLISHWEYDVPAGGGFTVNVVFYADCTASEDSFGIATLYINGYKASSQKFGARVSGGNINYVMPVFLTASAYAAGTSANFIELFVQSSNWADDLGTSNPFVVKSLKMSIHASKR